MLEVEGVSLVEYSIPLGSSACVDLLDSGFKLCEAWGSADIDGSNYDTMAWTSGDDATMPPLEFYMTVGGNQTTMKEKSLKGKLQRAGFYYSSIAGVFSTDSGTTTASPPKPFTPTVECILGLAETRVECLTVLSEGSSTSSVESCDGAIDTIDLAGASTCRCNPAINSLLGVSVSETCASREWQETYEYGCSASDASVDAQRFETLRRYKASFSKPRDEFLAELEAVLSSDAIVEFLGIGKYVGVQAIWEFGLPFNPDVNSGLLVAGLPESMSEISMDAGGFQSRTLDNMYVLSEKFDDIGSAKLKYVQGSFSSIQFLPCSGTISGVFKALDDFSFNMMTELLDITTSFGAVDTYDKTLMSSAIASIKHYESLRTNQCVQGIFLKSVHLYKMQKAPGSASRCLVLGETSYFKMNDGLANEKSFVLKYVTMLKTVNVDGELKYFQKADTDAYIVEIWSAGKVVAGLEVDIGENKCMSLFLVKFCVSTAEDASGRRLAEGASGRLHLEVDGEKTEPIVLWNESVTTSTTASPVERLPDKEAAYSHAAIRYMMPLFLIIVSLP